MSCEFLVRLVKLGTSRNQLPGSLPTYAHRAVLAKDAHDEDALRAKVHALLMLERYGDAQQLQSTRVISPLENAYCVWKTKGARCALPLLQSASDAGSLHLKALLLMRTGQPEQAAELYQSLLPTVRGDKQAVLELVRHTVARGQTWWAL